MARTEHVFGSASGGPEIFDYAATTGGGAVSGTELALSGDDAIEQFINGTNETSSTVTGGNSSFPAVSSDTSDFDSEVPEPYMVLAETEINGTAVL